MTSIGGTVGFRDGGDAHGRRFHRDIPHGALLLLHDELPNFSPHEPTRAANFWRPERRQHENRASQVPFHRSGPCEWRTKRRHVQSMRGTFGGVPCNIVLLLLFFFFVVVGRDCCSFFLPFFFLLDVICSAKLTEKVQCGCAGRTFD